MPARRGHNVALVSSSQPKYGETLPRDQFSLVKEFENSLANLGVAGGCVLAAVSGGGDSMALLELLRLSGRSKELSVEAAYVDHALRPEAVVEAAFVAATCRAAGVHSHCVRVADPGADDEEHLRDQRYAALERLANERDCRWIATAHSADDQIETMMFRLLRGSGLRGLAGIPPKRGRLVRPLLGVPRRHLRAFLRARGLGWMEDASNAHLRYRRNLIRHRILPVIVAELGEGALDRLPATAEIWRREDELLEEEAARHEAFVCCNGDSGREIDLVALAGVPPALRGRLLRRWLEGAGLDGQTDLRHVEALERILDSTAGRESVDLPGLTVVRDGATLEAVVRRPDERES